MIFIYIETNKNNFIKSIRIKGHAPLKEEYSIECSIVSALVDLLNLTFKEIYNHFRVSIIVKSGYFFMEINEDKKENIDFIEKFLAPIIKMFYQISIQYKNVINFEIIKSN
ncbi:MAG: ribosomal-processing cysteine protease Prp [Leptonema sp. (in: bacteria)]